MLQALGELGRAVLEAVAGAGDVVDVPQILRRSAAAQHHQRCSEDESRALRHFSMSYNPAPERHIPRNF